MEVDASQLRFSLEETKEFLEKRHRLPLSDDEISRLHDKSEGWITALSLASFAIERPEGRSEFIARFSGSNNVVAEYLACDVLERQALLVREFLLRTSILRHLNWSVCDAVLARDDSAQMLRSLEASGLFLVPIEGEERTYRYHTLFSEFLRTQLLNEFPDELPYQETYALLDSARRGQGAGSSFFNKMYTESIEGVIDLEAGRLRQARARLRMAVVSPHASAYSHNRGNAFAGVFYANTLYEANELEQATRLLHVYVPLARDANLADHMIMGYLHLARIAFERGDIDLVFQGLTELEYAGHQRQLPRVVASAKLERARILLLQGNRQASKDELERANDIGVWQRIRNLHLSGNLNSHEIAKHH